MEEICWFHCDKPATTTNFSDDGLFYIETCNEHATTERNEDNEHLWEFVDDNNN